MLAGNVIHSTLSQTEHPDECVYLQRVFLDEEVQRLIFPSFGRLPSRKSVAEAFREDAAASEDDAWVVPILDQMIDGEPIAIPQWDQDPTQVWTIWNNMYALVLSTEDSIPDLMAAAQAEVDAMLTT
jgi:ABC-type glycerol-3-phosphate transport system substrate-binding protein